MAEIVLTCWVETPGPTCHVYLSCALLFYFMYNMPEFSLYCEGCSRPLDLGANTFWEALQWEFEMMPINYSYPGIHQSCALNIFLSLKALVSTPALPFSSEKCGGKKKERSVQDAHMQNYSDLRPTCQSFSAGNKDCYFIMQIPLFKSGYFLIKSIKINTAKYSFPTA